MPSKPVKVAVISDSHAQRIGELPPLLLDTLTKVDAVIHLGDYTSPELLNDLRKMGNFFGIIGNHDDSIGRKELKVIEVVELAGKRLGLIHGLFLPIARPKRMRAWLKKYDVDALLFGHNHLVTNRMMNGVFLFNPGTVTGQFPATQATFGLLTLDGSITGEIVPLDYDIPYLRKKTLKIIAAIIRSGIRWLEAWPYIDLRPTVKSVRQTLAETAFIFRVFSSRRKVQ
jgi:putative phosphoesterase